jgi:hypothetical protein
VDLDSAGSVDPDSGKAKMDHKKTKNEEFSCFELLDVLFGGLGVSPVCNLKAPEALDKYCNLNQCIERNCPPLLK